MIFVTIQEITVTLKQMLVAKKECVLSNNKSRFMLLELKEKEFVTTTRYSRMDMLVRPKKFLRMCK